jgi:hypothetical protein
MPRRLRARLEDTGPRALLQVTFERYEDQRGDRTVVFPGSRL